MSTLLGNYVTPVPAQQRVGKHWYLGSADAIYQSLNLIHDEQPDIVVVVGADHVYRMDFSQMVDQHVDERRAVHGRRDPAADRAGRPVRRDRRAARRPARDPRVPREADGPGRACPTAPTRCWPAMGNYVFDADALVEAVTRDADDDRLQARHGRRHRARVRTPQRGRRLRLQGQRGAGRDRPRPRLLARRRDDAAPTTTRTWTWSRRCRSSTSTTPTGRSTPPTARSRRSSSPRAPTAARRVAEESLLSPGVVVSRRAGTPLGALAGGRGSSRAPSSRARC